MKEPNAVCQFCGKPYHARPSALEQTKYCSRECLNAARTKQVETTCTNCGKAIRVHATAATKWKRHFCSMACFSEYKAKTEHGGWSLESREKASRSKLEKLSDPNPDNYKRHLGKRAHREVAEKKLGRPLRPGEVVHHINGDKHDNRPENLMVFPNQQAHIAYHKAHPEESGVYLGKRGGGAT